MTENGYTLSDIAAVNGNRNDGMFGGDWGAWIILFLLFGMFNGRGFGGWGGGNAEPCATQADVRSAVDQQTLISKLDQQTYGLADSTYALNNAITNGFHGVDSGICNLSAQLAQCCCDNRAAIADVKYQMATDTCSIQNTIQGATRDIVENNNANARAILDFLTQDKIATLTAENQNLKLAASQANQNAVLMAAMDANKAEIIRRTGNDCPIPAYVVQPSTPVTFPYNNCGCGC